MLTFAMTPNIEKMYHQIKMNLADANQQQILWKKNLEQVFKCIQTTVVYGTACSLFLTARTIQQLAVDEQNSLELFQT